MGGEGIYDGDGEFRCRVNGLRRNCPTREGGGGGDGDSDSSASGDMSAESSNALSGECCAEGRLFPDTG
jgi:hypothetical protein